MPEPAAHVWPWGQGRVHSGGVMYVELVTHRPEKRLGCIMTNTYYTQYKYNTYNTQYSSLQIVLSRIILPYFVRTFVLCISTRISPLPAPHLSVAQQLNRLVCLRGDDAHRFLAQATARPSLGNLWWRRGASTARPYIVRLSQ